MIPIIMTLAEEPDDREFLTEMFDRFHRLMFSTAGKFSNDSFEKEDIVQESLVRLIAKVDTLRTLEPKALASYIVVTVKHTAINRLRKAANAEKLLHDIYDGDNDDIAQEYTSMDERIIISDDIGKLTVIWPRLTEAERFLLEGKYICNYTDEELAATLGCRESSIRMKLTRARRHALSLLTEEGVTIE